MDFQWFPPFLRPSPTTGKGLSQFQMALIHKETHTITKDRTTRSTNTSKRKERIIKHKQAQRRNHHKNNKEPSDGSRTSNDLFEPQKGTKREDKERKDRERGKRERERREEEERKKEKEKGEMR